MGARAVATRVAAAVGAVVLTASGCGFTGVYDLPLPGGADLGDHPYTVKVEFRDVLDLVPQSAVKVDEVAVGRVDSVGFAADGWTAEVTLLVRGDVDLPANASAKLRQSSLLGEKYVELAAPPTGTAAEGRLADGAVIPVGRTNRNTEVEEVLGALSLLLNGGGVEQLRDITRELNKATEGRETDIRALLDNVNSAVTTLDAGKADITRAIDGINRLAMTLNGQRDRIVGVIDDIGPGLKVLTDQREQLVTMLQSLDSLSGVAVDTVNRSQADLVADLKALTPTLLKLGEAGNDLPKSLELLITFPFTDAAVAGVKGDYFNIYADVDLNLSNVLDNLGRSRQNPLESLIPGIGGTTAPSTGATPAPGTSTSPLLPLPPLPGLGAPAAPPAAGAPPTPARTGLPGLLDDLLGGGA